MPTPIAQGMIHREDQCLAFRIDLSPLLEPGRIGCGDAGGLGLVGAALGLDWIRAAEFAEVRDAVLAEMVASTAYHSRCVLRGVEEKDSILGFLDALRGRSTGLVPGRTIPIQFPTIWLPRDEPRWPKT